MAKESGHATFPKSGHTHLTLSILHNGRHNTPPLLHCAAQPPLQRTPSLPFHGRRASRFKTAFLSALSSRPRFARRARHSGHSVCRLPLRYGRGVRLALYPTSLHYIPVCILQPTEPVPPTYCVSEAVCGGPAAFAESLTFPLRHFPHEIRSMYGGATFEIKKCSFIFSGGTHHQDSSCSHYINPLRMPYFPITGQALPIY